MADKSDPDLAAITVKHDLHSVQREMTGDRVVDSDLLISRVEAR